MNNHRLREIAYKAVRYGAGNFLPSPSVIHTLANEFVPELLDEVYRLKQELERAHANAQGLEPCFHDLRLGIFWLENRESQVEKLRMDESPLAFIGRRRALDSLQKEQIKFTVEQRKNIEVILRALRPPARMDS